MKALTAVVGAGLFVEPTPERLSTLRDVALPELLEPLAPTLELHGVLPLWVRNAHRAGVLVPEALDLRAGELRRESLRAQLTLERFLKHTARRGVRVMLLKGASLGRDLYGDPSLRSQGDVDVMVRPSELERARTAAEELGLCLSPRQFPVWWYRYVHFHLKLYPAIHLLKELEIHWRLQSPALLLCPPIDALWNRADPVKALGDHVWTLEVLDRYLHLVTHLLSHWRRPPAADDDIVDILVQSPNPPARLKWVVDLAAEAERLAPRFPSEALRARADEWNATRQLSTWVEWSRGLRTLAPPAADWLRRAAQDAEGIKVRSRRPQVEGKRPHPALDFRLEALTLLPRWIWPPRAYIARRYSGPAWAWQPLHALLVLLRILVALVLLPCAFVGRFLLEGRRRRRLKEALSPERLLDLAVALRRLEVRRS